MVNKFAVFETKLGWVGVTASPNGLRRLTFPRPSPQEAGLLLGAPAKASVFPAEFKPLVEEIRAYFSGKRVTFDSYKLDFSGFTPFQRSVWEVTRQIGYGKTESYSGVAARAGCPRGPRAVGQALGRNPLPIIVPCHRVVAGDGTLGGFGGGLDMKRHLLSLEGGEFPQSAWFRL